MTHGAVTTTYTYGADGTRLKRTVSGSTEVSGGSEPNSNGVTLTFGALTSVEIRDFGSDDEEVIAYPLPGSSLPGVRLVAGLPSFLHTDQLGSTRGVVNGSGRLLGAVRL